MECMRAFREEWGSCVEDRHVEHCHWAEQRAMAHQDERWGGLAMQYGGYGGLFMG